MPVNARRRGNGRKAVLQHRHGAADVFLAGRKMKLTQPSNLPLSPATFAAPSICGVAVMAAAVHAPASGGIMAARSRSAMAARPCRSAARCWPGRAAAEHADHAGDADALHAPPSPRSAQLSGNQRRGTLLLKADFGMGVEVVAKSVQVGEQGADDSALAIMRNTCGDPRPYYRVDPGVVPPLATSVWHVYPSACSPGPAPP